MINEFFHTRNCRSKIPALLLEPIKVSGGRKPRSHNLCSSCLMRPRSQWVYKTVKIYIYILHVTEFANIMPFPVPYSIYTVRHILAFGVKRIFCTRHLQESRFVNHRTLTTQASGFYCRCSGSTWRRFYLRCCTTSCKLHLSCFIAELVSQPRFPKYLKRLNETRIIRLTVL